MPVDVVIQRCFDNGMSCVGLLRVGGDVFTSLERPWAGNKKNISCVPPNPAGVIARFIAGEDGVLQDKWVREVTSKSYSLVLEMSPKIAKKRAPYNDYGDGLGMVWELKDVPNRSECKFHSAGTVYDLQGCIALGDGITSSAEGDKPYLVGSLSAMRRFHAVLRELKGVEQGVRLTIHGAVTLG